MRPFFAPRPSDSFQVPTTADPAYQASANRAQYGFPPQAMPNPQFSYLGSQLQSPQQSMVHAHSVLSYQGMSGAQGNPGEQTQYLSLFGQYVGPVHQSFPPQIDKVAPLFKIPQDATNCLYIDGIPIDAKEREVARSISPLLDIFRPYPGFISARLIIKEAKSGRKFFYCFVDFENAMQATIVLQSLQVLALPIPRSLSQ